MNHSVRIAVEGPWFFSAKDEESFYSWLNSIPSIVAVGGVGTIVELTLSTKRVPQSDLREILAIFHRYALDKRELAQLDRPQLRWFRDPKAYWYAEVFALGRPGGKRR
jgi:hypothetical protein